jgi:hypothetical protein
VVKEWGFAKHREDPEDTWLTARLHHDLIIFWVCFLVVFTNYEWYMKLDYKVHPGLVSNKIGIMQCQDGSEEY